MAAKMIGQTPLEKFYSKNDLAFDWYRGAIISGGTSLILNKAMKGKHPILCGLIGNVVAGAQGIILERGQSGKIVSCMGAAGGTMGYTIVLHLKAVKRAEMEENMKYKYDMRRFERIDTSTVISPR